MKNLKIVNKSKKISTFVFFLSLSFFLLFLSFNKLTNFDNENLTFNKYYQNCEQINIEINEIYKEINFRDSQLSLFPETNNIFCIGKVKSFNIKNGFAEIEIYSSFVFYKFLIILINLLFVSVSIVVKLKKNTTISILFFFYFSLSIFLETLFNFSGFINLSKTFIITNLVSVIYFLLFFNPIKNNGIISNLFDYGLIFFLIFDYQIFGSYLLVYFLVNFKKIIIDEKKYLVPILFRLPFVFYALRLFSGFSNKLTFLWISLSSNIYESPIRFLDFQSAIRASYCSKNTINDATYNFSTRSLSCPYESGYPLFDNLILISKNLDLWKITIIIVTLTFIFLAKVYFDILKSNIKNKLIFIFLVLSPPVNLLLERFNTDLLVFILLGLAISKINKYHLIKQFIIFITFLTKIYTFPVFLVGILSSILSKNRKQLISNILFLLFSISFLYFLGKLGGFEWSGSSIGNLEEYLVSSNWINESLTYGLFANFYSLGNILNLEITNALLINFIIIFFAFLILKKFDKVKIESSFDFYNIKIFSIFLLTGLFSNYDYRIPLLLLVLKYALEIKNNLFIFNFLFFFITSSHNFYFLNNLIVLFNIFSFNFIYLYFLNYIYKFLLNIKLKINH